MRSFYDIWEDEKWYRQQRIKGRNLHTIIAECMENAVQKEAGVVEVDGQPKGAESCKTKKK